MPTGLLIKKVLLTKKVNPDGLKRILRSIIEPARRHRCQLCSVIFECHLCGFDEEKTHFIHWTSEFVCEECIRKHGLWVKVNHSDNQEGHWLSYYDHLTGEFLGHGPIKRSER